MKPSTRIYQLPHDGEWVVDTVDAQGQTQIISTFPFGEPGLPYLHAFLRGYLNLNRKSQ